MLPVASVVGALHDGSYNLGPVEWTGSFNNACGPYTDDVVGHIISKCNDPDSGGRMVDNIITNTLLPALSREFLKKSLAKEPITQASVTVENNDFAYEWR